MDDEQVQSVSTEEVAMAMASTEAAPLAGRGAGSELSSLGAVVNSDGDDSDDVDGTDDLASRENDISGLLRTTVLELETALQDSRQLLEARDRELVECRRERGQLKEMMAKEILRKTELSSSLEESRQHVIALEALIEKWQDEVRQVKQREEVSRQQVADYAGRLEKASSESTEARAECLAAVEENGLLKQRITELEKKLHAVAGDKAVRSGSASGQDNDERDLNWAFLKTSILHYFTDLHPYEQAKAIVSILNFDAKQRMQIYAKLDEKHGRSRSSYYHRASSAAAAPM